MVLHISSPSETVLVPRLDPSELTKDLLHGLAHNIGQYVQSACIALPVLHVAVRRREAQRGDKLSWQVTTADVLAAAHRKSGFPMAEAFDPVRPILQPNSIKCCHNGSIQAPCVHISK